MARRTPNITACGLRIAKMLIRRAVSSERKIPDESDFLVRSTLRRFDAIGDHNEGTINHQRYVGEQLSVALKYGNSFWVMKMDLGKRKG